ncbi:CLUMA_CG009015, isoform A [Clunio marinus]|uniref:CLUMA_CG009015, isoform A n=1 Tax=Clunio marinus TaxID=568069 RepID=A0A1J1I9A3_9DIPT|nr:CLUMA_CG009015, isoform A [Clunio marinus]
MKDIVHKQLYSTLRSQVLSSNGKYLFVVSNHFDIATFAVEKIASCIESITNDDISNPISIYKCKEKVFSLAFNRDFLIVGSSGSVNGYQISDSGAILKQSWSIQLNVNIESYEVSEVNDLWVDSENDRIYAACGESSIYVCSLEDGFVIKNRPTYGKWIGSASINNEWVATGGGPSLALYHVRNRQPFQIFDFPKEIHVTGFVEDNLLVGGESNILCQYSFKGDVMSEIETSGPCVLSVVWQTAPFRKFLTACGASNKIDVSTNFKYKDTTLNFYSKNS